jgi:hypothetical protein
VCECDYGSTAGPLNVNRPIAKSFWHAIRVYCRRWPVSSVRHFANSQILSILLVTLAGCGLTAPALAQHIGGAGTGHGMGSTHSHPSEDEALHEKFYSTWYMPDNPSKSCCNKQDCYPTEIKYIGSAI